jgi:hypothetical protein
MSTKLSREKAAVAVAQLPSELRVKARSWMKKRVMDRYGSGTFNSRHPQRAVTERQKLLMRELHNAGLSFRVIERVMHLVPNSGNGAQRCVREAARLARRIARVS